MKDEEINLVPENMDISEIDKLTALPKGNGINYSYLTKIIFRSFTVLYFNVFTLHYNSE